MSSSETDNRIGVIDKLLLVFVIVVSSIMIVQSAKADEWSTDDKVRQAIYTAFHVADWAQTRHISKNCDLYEETNIFLGKCPSTSAVNNYFLAAGLIHLGISHALSKKNRAKWQLITIGIEGGYVARNYKIGIKFDF